MTDRLKTLGDSYDSSSERRRRTSSGEGGEALCAPGWGGNEGLTRGPHMPTWRSTPAWRGQNH